MLHQIEQAAGRGDDDIHPGFEGVDLFAVAHAAVNHRHGVAGETRVIAHGSFHLRSQFARGLENKHAGFARVFAELGNDGQHEGRCFAGAGLRAADHVGALKQQRDGAQLDGRGVGPAHGFDAVEDWF